MNQIQEYLKQVEAINYRHSEGPRYAYVQLMVYTREMRNLLEGQKGFEQELRHIDNVHEKLNELVALKFGDYHKQFFDESRRLIGSLFRLYKTQPVESILVQGSKFNIVQV